MITSTHKKQMERLGSALASPGDRRSVNAKAREDYDLAIKLQKMAEQRYSQRYAGDILGLTKGRVVSLCLRFSIQFNAPSAGGRKLHD